MKYEIVIDPMTIEKELSLSPYNLKKDMKDINNNDEKAIVSGLRYELINGPGRGSYAICYKCKRDIRIHYAKIRVPDEKRNRGKSGGYRVISLIDSDIQYCFVLHIYRHAHGEDNDISKNDKNSLEKLVEEYYNSKCRWIKEKKEGK